MSSTHKIPALRSLATKVALGLGITLVASSIAPMAVAPASATSPDVGIWSISSGSQANIRGAVAGLPGNMTPVSITIPGSRSIYGTAIIGSTVFYTAGSMNSNGADYVGKVNVDGTNASQISLNYSAGTLYNMFDLQADGTYLYFTAATSQNGYPKIFKVDTTDPSWNVVLVFDITSSGERLYSWTVDSGTVYGVARSSSFANNVQSFGFNINRVVTTTTLASEAQLGLAGTETCTGGMPMVCTYTGVGNSYPSEIARNGSNFLFTLDSWDNGANTTYLYEWTGSALNSLSWPVANVSPTAVKALGNRYFVGYATQNPGPQSTFVSGVAEVSVSNATLNVVSQNTGVSSWAFVVSATAIPTLQQQQQQQQQQNNAPAQPAPQLDLSGLKTIPAPTAGISGGVAGIDLKGKNLPTVASVTVAGKEGKVVTSTDTALKLDLPTMAPGSYDIVMKTEAGGSITIQNGLVIAPPVDTTPVQPVVLTPSVPRTKLVAATTPVPGFQPGKKSVSEAQKAIIQDVVLTKNVTSLECVGVTSSKVSAKLASARAAAICAAAKAQNPGLTTSVKTVAEAKVNGPIGSVLINYNH